MTSLFILFLNIVEIFKVIGKEKTIALMKIFVNKSDISLDERIQIASKFNIEITLLNDIFMNFKMTVSRRGRPYFGE